MAGQVVITGASGFIGRAVSARLAGGGHTVQGVSARGERIELPACDAVVHLAGEPVAQRWTAKAKRRIRESRVEGSRKVVEAIGRLPVKPRVLVAASAVGYYGSRGEETLAEESAPGDDFLARVCREWEAAAGAAAGMGVRVVHLRIGMVLGGGGGALAKMLPAFRVGAGARLGSGRQWMSWIHLDDLTELVSFAIGETSLRGPVNATAPNPVTNADFTRELAQALHRPAFAVAPAFLLRLMFGEMAEMLLASQRVLPRAAPGAGFVFRYPELGPALALEVQAQ